LPDTMVVAIHVVAERPRLREVRRALRLLNLPHVVLMGHQLLVARNLVSELIIIG